MLLRKYNAAATILFPLITKGATDLTTAATFAAGDTKLIKDEGAAANATNNPVHEGNGIYSLALTAAELQAARLAVTIVDQSAPKIWEDQALFVETYGNASAQHELDLDDAQLDVNVAAMAAGVLTASALATDAAQEIADELLKRPISNVEPGAAFRTLYGAIASLVNRRRILSGNVEVFKTDDVTTLATIPITTNPSQEPITELDPP